MSVTEQEHLDHMVAELSRRQTLWERWGRPFVRGCALQGLAALGLWGLGLDAIDAVRWSVAAGLAWGCMLVPLALAWGVATAMLINAAERRP